MYKSIKIEHALKNGDLVHISEVNSGLKCECTCVCCDSKLVARKGDKMSHHFAHHKSEDCNGAYETILHILAKEILKESKSIVAPEIFFCFFYIRFKEMVIKYDFVELEKRLGDIKPDIVVYKDNKPLLIEIYVTHKVDDIKKAKIKELGLSALEIDLSDIDRYISKEELKDIILNDKKRKSWINNIPLDKLIKNHEKKLLSYLTKHKIMTGDRNWKGKYILGCPKLNRTNWKTKVGDLEYGDGCEECKYFNGFEYRKEIITTIYKDEYPYKDEYGYYDDEEGYYNEDEDKEGKGYFHIFDKNPDSIYCGFNHKITDFNSYLKVLKSDLGN